MKFKLNKKDVPAAEAMSELAMMNANATIAGDADQEDETAMAGIALAGLVDDDQTNVVLVSGGNLAELKKEVVGNLNADKSKDFAYDGDYVCVTVIDGIIHVLVDGALNSEVPV